MQSIGERLEEARKKKGISIREAAEATKIRGEYLQKFEGNQFEIGLTDIYTRGFLRGYANYLRIPSDRHPERLHGAAGRRAAPAPAEPGGVRPHGPGISSADDRGEPQSDAASGEPVQRTQQARFQRPGDKPAEGARRSTRPSCSRAGYALVGILLLLGGLLDHQVARRQRAPRRRRRASPPGRRSEISEAPSAAPAADGHHRRGPRPSGSRSCASRTALSSSRGRSRRASAASTRMCPST